VRGIAAVALAAYALCLSNLFGVVMLVNLAPTAPYEVPFVAPAFIGLFGVVTVPFAIALGFRQSSWEAVRGTYLFLLHRPVGRQRVFLAKMAVGVGTFLACSGGVILAYACRTILPGHHPSPFEWSMTGPAWRLCLVTPLLYLGAFLSGLRPARWFGTRLLPLAAAGGGVVYLVCTSWWWQLGFPLAVVMYVIFTAQVRAVARVRDYS
jgi:hypothetical protein